MSSTVIFPIFPLLLNSINFYESNNINVCLIIKVITFSMSANDRLSQFLMTGTNNPDGLYKYIIIKLDLILISYVATATLIST